MLPKLFHSPRVFGIQRTNSKLEIRISIVTILTHLDLPKTPESLVLAALTLNMMEPRIRSDSISYGISYGQASSDVSRVVTPGSCMLHQIMA